MRYKANNKLGKFEIKLKHFMNSLYIYIYIGIYVHSM